MSTTKKPKLPRKIKKAAFSDRWNYGLTKYRKTLNGLEKQGDKKPAKNIAETWKDMRLEVYQQASGNRHEPNYSDYTTKMFSLNDIDEIIEKMSEQKPTDKTEPKFHEGDMIIHKELGGDYIHNPHKIIQVDILDKKYCLEGGFVAHFSEQDDYELVEQKTPTYFYCKCGGAIPKCSDCERNHLNSKYETKEIKTWMTPASRGTKQCSNYIQKASAWSEKDDNILKSIINQY